MFLYTHLSTVPVIHAIGAYGALLLIHPDSVDLSERYRAARREYAASTNRSVSVDMELAAVAQRRGDGIDRQLNAFPDSRIGLAGPVALEQFHLQQIQRFDIG